MRTSVRLRSLNKKVVKYNESIKILFLFLNSFIYGFSSKNIILPKFNNNINKRFKEYTNEEMQHILKEILRYRTGATDDLTKEVRETTRLAYEYLQRNTHKNIYYLGWIPFYNDNKKIYSTPYYFIFLEKINTSTIYLDFVFQNSLWFDIYNNVHVNNFIFYSDLYKFSDVGNYTLNIDKINLQRFVKFKVSFKYDELFYN